MDVNNDQKIRDTFAKRAEEQKKIGEALQRAVDSGNKEEIKRQTDLLLSAYKKPVFEE